MSTIAATHRFRTISLDDFARKCVREANRGRLVVLAGAGVSMLSPSRLPSGYDLKRMAVEDVCAPRQFRRHEARILRAPAFDTLVPEVLFQRFYDCVGDRLLPFFDVIGGSDRNVAHEVLARLATKCRTPVITTNFDGLIEESRPSLRVLHLHGELTRRMDMVVRLHQVGKGLPPAISAKAGRLIRHRVVCILGYSGNDEDVRQLLREHRPSEVLWLVRNPTDPAWRNIRGAFADFEPIVGQGSLRSLVNRIAGSFRWLIPKPHRPRSPLGRVMRTWHHALTTRDRYAILAEALLEVRQYRFAARLATEGAAHCPPNERPSWFHVQAGEALRILADDSRALQQARLAVRIAERCGDFWDRAAALNAVGLDCLERRKTNSRRARLFFRRAVRALHETRPAIWSERVIGFAARVYNNLGLAEMELRHEKAARAAFARSMQLKRRVGDLPGLGTTAANMAILHAKFGRRIAIRWRRRAFVWINRYDHKFRAAYLHRRFGEHLCAQGRVRSGLDDLHEALRIYQEILRDGFGAELTRSIIARYTSAVGP